MTTIYEFFANDLTGKVVDFQSFKGKVLLIVNTASECGLTPQFAELQALHEKYHAHGLIIIGFPCNQFGKQEPNDGIKISEFCQKNYGVEFLMMDKIEVNGDNAHPLYQWLKTQKGGLMTNDIKWNFSKFLISKDGKVIHRYAPITKPKALEKDIIQALADE